MSNQGPGRGSLATANATTARTGGWYRSPTTAVWLALCLVLEGQGPEAFWFSAYGRSRLQKRQTMASALIVSAQNGQALSPCAFDATPGSATAGDSGAAAAGVALLGKSATMSPNGPKKSPIKNQPNPLRPFEDATTALKTAKSNAKKRISIKQIPHGLFVVRTISQVEYGDAFKPGSGPCSYG